MKQKIIIALLAFFTCCVKYSNAQLYIRSGATLYVDNNSVLTIKDTTLILDDNITGSGSGKIVMTGLHRDTIYSNNHSIFGLEVDHAEGVVLADSLTVNGASTMTNGLLTMNDRKLTLNGLVTTTNGLLEGSNNSILAMGSTSNGNVGDLKFVNNNTPGNKLHNLLLDLSGTGGATDLLDTVVVLNKLQVLNGTLHTNGKLILRSDQNNTAFVAALPANSSIDGDVVVERYIPGAGNRAWRLLAAPLQAASAPTILNSWQEASSGTNPKPGYGTNVTKPGALVADGWDMASNTTSLQYWNGAALVTPTNTNITKVTDHGAGWFLFVRGDKSITPATPAASGATTLRMTGPLNQGNLTNVGALSTIGATGFSLIPNPYPSRVNFEMIRAANGNINEYYAWDATLSSIGAYRTVERQANGSYEATPPTANDDWMRYIQGGQAFFVKGNTGFSFTESMKTDSMPSTNVFKTTGIEEQLLVTLKSTNANGTDIIDAFRLKFDPSYDTAVTSEDVIKINNINENLFIYKSNTNLVINRQPLPTTVDTIHLKFTNTAIKNYELYFQPTNFSSPIYAYLLDNHSATITPISLSGTSSYFFSVSNVTTTWNPDRFKIIFSPGNPLSLSDIHLTATKKEGNANLTWVVKHERGIKGYELEKGTDGKTFLPLEKTSAKANDGTDETYEATDSKLEKENFYRVKVTALDGEMSYSNTVRISNEKQASLVVFPNPITSNTFHLKMNNMDKGTYNVVLSNTLGQTISLGKIDHDGVNETHTLSLSTMLAQGNYMIRIVDNAGVAKAELPVTVSH